MHAYNPSPFPPPKTNKVHLLPTDTLGVSVGPTGYFHHTEPWPDAHVRREREQVRQSKPVEGQEVNCIISTVTVFRSGM